ncbi:MAG TPA: hypothetical protein VNA66_14180, partial [Gammaproteobacteria bacterium]|nr:hypothetical protein [Gammaproteobacteria bacterium]
MSQRERFANDSHVDRPTRETGRIVETELVGTKLEIAGSFVAFHDLNVGDVRERQETARSNRVGDRRVGNVARRKTGHRIQSFRLQIADDLRWQPGVVRDALPPRCAFVGEQLLRERIVGPLLGGAKKQDRLRRDQCARKERGFHCDARNRTGAASNGDDNRQHEDGRRDTDGNDDGG